MRWRCFKRGRGGSGVTSLGLGIATSSDTVTVRCSHSGEILWRTDRSSFGTILRGKRTLRFEKTAGSVESTQAFVVRVTSRKESFVDKGRRERRCEAGKWGE